MPSSGTDLLVAISEDGVEVDNATMNYTFASSGLLESVAGVPSSDPGVWSFRLPASPDCPDSVVFEFSASTTAGEDYSDGGGPYAAQVADGESSARRL